MLIIDKFTSFQHLDVRFVHSLGDTRNAFSEGFVSFLTPEVIHLDTPLSAREEAFCCALARNKLCMHPISLQCDLTPHYLPSFRRVIHGDLNTQLFGHSISRQVILFIFQDTGRKGGKTNMNSPRQIPPLSLIGHMRPYILSCQYDCSTFASNAGNC